MVSDGGQLDLEAIKARTQAATEGTWVVANSEMLGIVQQDLDANGLGLVYGRDVVQAIGYEDDEQAQADAAFIAAARSDVPALVAEVERLTQENQRIKNERILSVVFGHVRDAPKPFALYRRTDVTGVSGTGVVALGAEWPDGTVVLRWTSAWPTSVVFHDRGMESVKAVHGHDGKTEVVWLSDELEPRAEMEQEIVRLTQENARLRAPMEAVECEPDGSWNELVVADPLISAAAVKIPHGCDERHMASAERDVIEKAKAWRAALSGYVLGGHELPLAAAVDALTQPEGTDGG